MMKKTIAALALLPVLAWAGPGEDYASQWPLLPAQPNAGAYRVVLDEAVYRQAQSPLLADLDVLDAGGQPVPAALFDPGRSQQAPAAPIEVPWFPLPPAASRPVSDIAAISEIATDGSLRRVELRAGAGGAGNAVLIDASRVDAPIVALHFEWAVGQAPFERSFRVLASDDLKDWRSVQDEAHLVDLENDGRRVVSDRIGIEPVRARYLRLVPLQAAQTALVLRRVRAETQPAAARVDWTWRTLDARAVEGADGVKRYEFQLDGRFPIERADVALPGNSTQEWTLESRDDPASPWRPAAAPWIAYRLQSAEGADASPPQALHESRRDRHWRLTPRLPIGAASPQLRLGYRPETLVFIAQGTAPFALVAGSARAHRTNAPLAQLMEGIRARRGDAWQPAEATLGAPRTLAGTAALTPTPAERDWKAWLLWALLIAGAGVVLALAISLLRKPAQ